MKRSLDLLKKEKRDIFIKNKMGLYDKYSVLY